MSEPGRAGAPAWTDSHCHLQGEFLGAATEIEAIAERAASFGVARAICIGTNEASSLAALALARRSGELPLALWATVGLHPHEASDGAAPLVALARKSAPAPKSTGRPPGSLVGIGECGLDYHYDLSPRPVQRAVFAEQAALAAELDLTLVVHTRDAWDDTVAILQEAQVPRVVIHCFTGGPGEAESCLALGAWVSFSGIVTFKNAEDVRAAARICPPERVLIETDAPFLAPVPHRGTANEPARVTVVGAFLAELLGVPVDEVARRTTTNATRAFALAAAP
ncbi:MAG: TatD family hydrolase [Actinomycetota bacterium]|nr:TatD family hydrolase [Actinomycetota bacterium]